MSAERDLAEAIHHEIISPDVVEYALEVWRDSLFLKTWTDADRIKWLLIHVSSAAIDAVLARRQSEAARGRDPTNPFAPTEQFVQERGDYQEEDGYPGSLVPRKRGTP